jgi:hypothetical protein
VTLNCGAKLIAEFGDAFPARGVIRFDLDKQTFIDDCVRSVPTRAMNLNRTANHEIG